ncbi:MAG: HD domain-containing protein [Chloroflexi bacterium]|nr:HD domain-containing protein [Chloroflexota bacterium]
MLNFLDLPLIRVVREIAQARKTPVLLVGGAIRDALLNRPIHDFDFAVQGNAVALARAVANQLDAAFYIMDAERGTARVITTTGHASPANQADALHLDFALCRGSTWDEDLFGRDFSVNAIGLDLTTGRMLDPTGGQADLPGRIIRQVTPHAIDDDPVRALRAVRLALTLSGSIEPATITAVRAAASQLGQPSPERVRDELMKTLAHPAATRAVRQLDTLGLLSQIVPEVEPMRNCEQSQPHRFAVLEHTFVVMEYLDEILKNLREPKPGEFQTDHGEFPAWLQGLRVSASHRDALTAQLSAVTTNERSRAALLRLATLLHDTAKPATRSIGADGRIHFYGHEEAGADMAAVRANTLKLSSDEVEQVRTTVRYHMRPNQMSRESDATGPTARAIYRFMRDAGMCAPEVALFCIADGMGKAGTATPLAEARRRSAIAALLIERYYQQFSPAVAPKPLIGGKDLLAIGIPQGPRIGQILNAVREAQMVGEISSPAEAMALAQSLQTAGEDQPPHPIDRGV